MTVITRREERLEDWLRLNDGAPIDGESGRKIAQNVTTALTVLGTAAHSVSSVAARAVGVRPDTSITN